MQEEGVRRAVAGDLACLSSHPSVVAAAVMDVSDCGRTFVHVVLRLEKHVK